MHATSCLAIEQGEQLASEVFVKGQHGRMVGRFPD